MLYVRILKVDVGIGNVMNWKEFNNDMYIFIAEVRSYFIDFF